MSAVVNVRRGKLRRGEQVLCRQLGIDRSRRMSAPAAARGLPPALAEFLPPMHIGLPLLGSEAGPTSLQPNLRSRRESDSWYRLLLAPIAEHPPCTSNVVAAVRLATDLLLTRHHPEQGRGPCAAPGR